MLTVFVNYANDINFKDKIKTKRDIQDEIITKKNRTKLKLEINIREKSIFT